jgi:segregation and condensation protein A
MDKEIPEEPDAPDMEPQESLEFQSEESDLENLEAVPQGQEKEYLVDLIDQPAWKTILTELVKRNKMDPWNIDVIALADLYWQKIQQLEKQDLRVPANAILASAILLKMKARTIKLSSVEEEEEETKEISKEEMAMIEETLPELRGQRQFREGKISLDELVSSIGEILEKTRQKKSILHEKELPSFDLEFNKEKAEEVIKEVFQKIREKVDSQGLVMFSELLEEETPVEIVKCFMPVLFLVNKGEINAWQDEWFGEIFISLNKEKKESA